MRTRAPRPRPSRVAEHLAQAEPPAPEVAEAILARVRERQRAVGYDGDLAMWLAKVTPPGPGVAMKLKYGANPHQSFAEAVPLDAATQPVEVLNGNPSYINLLDALNAWQLVREAKLATGPRGRGVLQARLAGGRRARGAARAGAGARLRGGGRRSSRPRRSPTCARAAPTRSARSATSPRSPSRWTTPPRASSPASSPTA